ncbi:hypothetical protein QZH41_015496, partial [Actinostola sp. cb2023]
YFEQNEFKDTGISFVSPSVAQLIKLGNANNLPTFNEGECPQQINGCDCGVYVISITRHVCKQYLGLTSQSIMNAVNAHEISDTRRHIKDLISQLHH